MSPRRPANNFEKTTPNYLSLGAPITIETNSSDSIRQDRDHDILAIRDHTRGIIRRVPRASDLKVYTSTRLNGAAIITVPRLKRAEVDVAGTDVGVTVAGEVNVVRDTAAQQDAVADLVPPDALRVGLEARLVPGDIRVD